jgi:uncharacterized protein (TIGR02996 family)
VLVSTYHLSDTERVGARRVWIDARPVVIGRAPDCHVVIDDPEVADHHLSITTRGDGAIIVDNLATAIDVDGTPVAMGASLVVAEGRAIRVGGTIVKLRMQEATVKTQAAPPSQYPMQGPPGNPPAPTPYPRPPPPRLRPRKDRLSSDDTEQSFLSILRANPTDSDTRLVYADWLEGNGFNAKAQLLRLREHLDTFMHRNATDIDWRVVAVRTPIDHCIQNKCPGFWDALAASGMNEFARTCGNCKHSVRYCADLSEVRSAGFDNAPVVFDAGLDRVAAHAIYRDPQSPLDQDELDDDPDGYTLDTPGTPFRK